MAVYLARFIFVSVLCLIGSVASASAYETTLFNDGWSYTEQKLDPKKPEAFDWQPVSIPHTWNATDTVDAIPGYRRGEGWYKKTFKPTQRFKRWLLHFEAANMEAEIYLNGKRIASHTGGYIGFDVELSSHIKTKRPNTLLVKVSNAYNPYLIPSQKSDFFIHGGITRDIWLIGKDSAYVDSIRVQTPYVADGDARTDITLFVDSLSANKVTAVAELRDTNGQLVAAKTKDLALTKGMNKSEITLPNFDGLALWSPDNPSLYQLSVKLLDAKSKKTLDLKQQNIGFRWFEVIPGKGFFINGERLLLRGTHRHEEMAGLGSALSNEQHYADMQMIKDLGANFVRLGHYPQDPEVYRAADELGLIIWDELPWCRGGIGPEKWQRNTEALLVKQIEQNYNHPSIAFWSLGNEMYWEADFEGGGSDEFILPYLKKLNALTKDLDPSRFTSIRKYYPGADVVDVFSPSIWAGWYGGAYGQYESAIKTSIAKYPNFIHMEYGGSSHVGRHDENPIAKEGMLNAQVSVEEAMNQAVVTSVAKASNWNENYMVDLFDWYLNVTEHYPGLTGTAQWAVRDFATPLRPENPIPYVNQKGLLDRAGKPKDAYYVFASYWSNKPFCYIESHSWTVRYGPEEGREVNVFCNTHSAELFLNDESLKEKQKQPKVFPAGGLVWQVPFKEGANKLSVIGRDIDGKVVASDEYSLLYHVGQPGKFERLALKNSVLENGNILLEAEALDKEGKRVTDFSDRIYFSSLAHDDALFENYGTPTRSSTIEAANGYAAIELKPLSGNTKVVVEAKTQNFKGVYITIGQD